MKKRLISMLMAVLMIASLLPASTVFAAEDECKHANTKAVTVTELDAKTKVPGIVATVCNSCGEVTKVTVEQFKKDGWLFKCSHDTSKVVEVQKVGCGQFGLTVSYCADCGKQIETKELAGKDGKAAYYKVEAALKHVYDEFTVEVEPTCTEDGWGYVTCKNCGDPQFIANAADAVSMLEPDNYANAAAYQKRYAEVNGLYVKTDPAHDGTKFVTVTKEISNFVDDNGKTVTLTPASDYVHANTISGVYSATEGKIVAASETSKVQKYKASVNGTTVTFTATDALGAVVSRDADKYCASCHEVIYGEEKTDEKHVPLGNTPKELGYAPYIDKNGYEHDGKTDVWKCATCNKTYGGVRLDFDEYFNFNDTASLKKDKYSVSDIVIPGTLVTCHSNGWTDAVVAFDKSTGKWTVKEVSVEVTKNPAHNMVSGTAVDPDCKNNVDGWIYKNYKYCANDGCTYFEGSKDDTIKIPAEHDWVKTAIAPATCKSAGIQVEKCSKCNSYKTDEDGNIEYKPIAKITKHVADTKLANVKAATCTEVGNTGDTVCKYCGKIMKAGTEIKALGHKETTANVKDATCTAAGYTGDTVCSVCKETLKKGSATKALGHDFVNGVCTRCDAKKSGYNPFTDVKEGAYYDAILWAYENGVTEGQTATVFGVNDKCTRAQIVTFLYRAAGSPTIDSSVKNPFTDVSSKSNYYNAIMWAVANGITEGTTKTTFSPNAACTRAQIVTFLWRYEGKPIVSVVNNFSDVSKDSVYYNAIMWAVDEGVTSGVTKTTFEPGTTCTRAQAVTFIYRDFTSK